MIATHIRVFTFILAPLFLTTGQAVAREIVVPAEYRAVVRALTNQYEQSGVLRRLGLPPRVFERLIITTMWQESRFRPRATSHAGARGLMQLMPGTARALGVQDSYDPTQNIMGGVRYLVVQLGKFGCVEHALAAYNAGPHRVEQYKGIPPFRETRNYVRVILSVSGLAEMEPYSRRSPIPVGPEHCTLDGEGATGVTTASTRFVTEAQRAQPVTATRQPQTNVRRRPLPSWEPGLLTDENWTPPRAAAVSREAPAIQRNPVVFSTRSVNRAIAPDDKEMFIQLGAFRRPDWGKLDAEIERFKNRNIPVFIEEIVSADNKRYRRLISGPYTTRRNRQEVLNFVRRYMGVPDAFADDRRYFEVQGQRS